MEKATGLTEQIQQLVTAQDLTVFMYVCGIGLAGAIVNMCFVKHDSFRGAVANFFGSFVFGTATGSLLLKVSPALAYVASFLLGLFGKKTYEKMEKIMPSLMAKKAGKMIDE